jgi:hypothetical protein
VSKKALIVGINNFASVTSLRGCINDTIAMQGLLETYFGFQTEDIRYLRDQEATGQGIRDGLAWLLSDYEGGGKDVRVFHFSSHGTYVDDQGDDEDELMPRDEVIVPYDHDWDDPFRDDYLRELFAPIPVDVNFTFVADCCHSGTIQKGPLEQGLVFEPRQINPPEEIRQRVAAREARRREKLDAMMSEGMVELLKNTPPDQWDAAAKAYAANFLKHIGENVHDTVDTDRHVLLAACQDRQTAADARIAGDWRGAFTWALSGAIQESNGDLTYDELISRAAAKIQDYEQRPQLECPANLRHVKVLAPLAP